MEKELFRLDFIIVKIFLNFLLHPIIENIPYFLPIPRSRAVHPSIGLIIVRTPIGNERSKSGYNINHLSLAINHIVVKPIFPDRTAARFPLSRSFVAPDPCTNRFHVNTNVRGKKKEKTSPRSIIGLILTAKQP